MDNSALRASNQNSYLHQWCEFYYILGNSHMSNAKNGVQKQQLCYISMVKDKLGVN